MKAEDLKNEIEIRRAIVAPRLREIEDLERQYAEALSREFIAAHGITKDMVQPSDTCGWEVSTLWQFGTWMEENGCTKPWCEWNGRLYPSSEVKAGSMRHNAPGLYEHVRG